MSNSVRSGGRVLVTGAGGFIGHHLVSFLKKRGYWVPGVDLKHPEYAPTAADEFQCLDLRRWENCLEATPGIDEVYALAADMGGMGFISSHHAQILHNNILISTHTLDAARENGVSRYLYTSSACVYPEYRQLDTNVEPLREDHAYPAAPQDAYGWRTDYRTPVCALPRRLRCRDEDRSLAQHIWTARHVGRRPRKGAYGAVSQGRRWQS